MMKCIYMLFSIFFIIIITACNSSTPSTRTVVTPSGSSTTSSSGSVVTITLSKDNPGVNISKIDLAVQLPAGVKESLIDYQGAANISGRITANSVCLTGLYSFQCPANLSSVGSLSATCTINQKNIGLLIHFQRSILNNHHTSILLVELQCNPTGATFNPPLISY